MGSWYSCREQEISKEERDRWVLFAKRCRKASIISALVSSSYCCCTGEHNVFHPKAAMEQLMAVLQTVAPHRKFNLVKGETLEQQYCILGAGGGTGGVVGIIQLWNIEIEEC